MKAELQPCTCGEGKYIYFKHLYYGRRFNAWIVECGRCGNLVTLKIDNCEPEVHEACTTAWNNKDKTERELATAKADQRKKDAEIARNLECDKSLDMFIQGGYESAREKIANAIERGE